MPGPEEITSRLEQAGIDYCIVSGLASIAYGRPRLTLDADLVVAMNPRQIASLIEAFPSADFYLPPAEILQAELQRDSRGHFNIIHRDGWTGDGSQRSDTGSRNVGRRARGLRSEADSRRSEGIRIDGGRRCI
jgi:hypothetical protein